MKRHKKIEALQSLLRDAQKELSELREEERREENDDLVGRFFVYRNCYSCPDGPEDYWNLYTAVLGVTDSGYVRTLRLQRDKYGKIEIETDEVGGGASLGEEISEEEFEAAKSEIFASVRDLLKGRLITELEDGR